MTIWQPEETARFLDHVRPDRLAALYELAAYAGLRQAELCGLRWSDVDEDGAGLTVRQTIVEVVRSQVKPGQIACPGCGVVRLHDTRHGACSLLLAGGVPMEVVQIILGHSSPEVTRRVYRHLLRKATAAQVESATELLTQHRVPVENDEDPDDDGTAGVLAKV